MALLNKKQKEEYINSGGFHCPFCGSKEIEAEAINHEDDISQWVNCLTCGERWLDILTVTQVYTEEDVNEP